MDDVLQFIKNLKDLGVKQYIGPAPIDSTHENCYDKISVSFQQFIEDEISAKEQKNDAEEISAIDDPETFGGVGIPVIVQRKSNVNK